MTVLFDELAGNYKSVSYYEILCTYVLWYRFVLLARLRPSSPDLVLFSNALLHAGSGGVQNILKNVGGTSEM